MPRKPAKKVNEKDLKNISGGLRTKLTDGTWIVGKNVPGKDAIDIGTATIVEGKRNAEWLDIQMNGNKAREID